MGVLIGELKLRRYLKSRARDLVEKKKSLRQKRTRRTTMEKRLSSKTKWLKTILMMLNMKPMTKIKAWM